MVIFEKLQGFSYENKKTIVFKIPSNSFFKE